MCDCFHVVLPTWPGAPGSVSGRQLQPEEPGADTEDDHSVTEGPVDELIRPRPQGSSPVYECAAEDAASGLQEDAPGRHGSASRRWSWWKRDPGDSRTSSRMSRPEGATELTLETEAEAGASGYSVTGRDQGIFVKQVLKGSSAAKLFSLQEGDQLLSATVFFDNIKYEDALKILQYSEPYKVQFKIRRRLPASEDEEGASRGTQHGTPGQEGQDKDVTEVYTETPTKTAGGGGDRERLISKPRQERGRRPQKERLSWPRFHSVKSKRGPGPRRSLSSSEARGGGPDLSPTSTDTEAQLPAEQQEQAAGPGGQRRKRFLNLRLRRSKGAQSGPGHPEALEEWGLWGDSLEGAGTAAPSREEEQVAQGPGPASAPREPLVTEAGLLDLSEGGTGGEVGRRRSKNGVKAQEEREKPRDTQAQPALKAGWEGSRDTVQSLEGATARLSLRDTAHGSGTQSLPQEVRVQIPDLKIPKFVFSKEKFLQTESDRTAARTGAGTGHSSEGPRPKGAQAGAAESRTEHRDRGPRDRSQPSKGEVQAEAEDKELREARMKMPRFRIPSWGWSPGKEPVASEKAREPEGTEGREVQTGGPKTDSRKDKGEEAQQGVDRRHQEKVHEEEQSSVRAEGGLSVGDKDSKLKKPKFKMPSFGVSAPRKPIEASADAGAPRVGVDVSLPSVKADTSDHTTELPSASLGARTDQVGVRLTDIHIPKITQPTPPDTHSLKGHLPPMKPPSTRMPKADLKDPEVHVKGPKVDPRGPKGELRSHEPDGPLPSLEIDIQMPEAQLQGVRLEGDVSLGDKDLAPKDSKFKMPKFKVPSFGVSSQDKSIKAEVDVSLPSVQADVETSDLTTEVSSADLETSAGQVGVTLPECQVPTMELPASDATGSLKGHLPKVRMPSIKMPSVKMPKVDLKGPEVDVKGPKVDLQGPKEELSGPEMEVPLSSLDVSVQAPGAQLEGGRLDGDMSMKGTDLVPKDSKFKMPKFQMPSFGTSSHGKPIEASVDTSATKVEAEMSLPSVQADGKTSDLTIELPSGGLEASAGQVGMKLPGSHTPKTELPAPDATGSLKGHLPKVKMPSVRVPKVDLKGPKVDVRGPKVDLLGPHGKLGGPPLAGSPPALEVDLQAFESQEAVTVLGADVSASLPHRERTAPTAGDLLPTSCQKPDAVVSIVGKPEGAGPKEAAPSAQGSWFRLPRFRLPGFGRSSSQESSGAGEQVQGEAVAQDKALDAKASAATSPQSPEVDAAVSTSGSASQSGVVRWDLDDTGLPSPLPTVGVARAELPTTQASTLPASAPLPLQERPCGPRSPGHAPALTRAQERAGPQGPLVLTASHADEPVQTAAVRAGPLWEDSVLTVRFPRLTVPRFSFPAHSAEADVFIPTVKEVHWLEAGPDAALPEAGPTLWEASVLKAGTGAPWEQPVALGLPLEAPPVSKVRVHIQGAQGESQEVTTHGRETPELAGVSAPQAPCTQIVRASEIPASTIQMPSYGFSLLTVKIPEPPMQAEVCTVMLDAWRQEGSEEVPTQATAGVDRISGDPLSDRGGPFEIVSSSGDVPGAQALTSALRPDCQLADGCSEEEQVKILELLPEDSRGETPPPLGKDGAAKERPENKRAGLFWAWLPDIGFSSSVEEPSADSKEAHPRATPVQTQPGVQPQADLLKRQEKGGWFRFPRLGFSSAKKGRSSEDKADLVEQSLQEETVTFFDARESFCPEEQEDGDVAEVACTGPHPGVMAARTELPLTEQDKASADPTPRLVAK